MLSKSQRLTRADFDSLPQRAGVLHGSLFSLKTTPAKGVSKFAVVISAKIMKKSVDRHLIKRRVMEAVHKVKTKEGFSNVFYAKAPSLTSSFKQINTEVLSLLDRAHVLQ